MRWPTVLTLVAVSATLGGCDRIPFLGGRQAADSSAADTTAAATPPTTTAAAPESTAVDSQPAAQTARPPTRRVGPTERQAAGEQAAARQPTTVTQPQADTPWTPTFTGTVDPGMTREQVVAVWGPPVADRGVGTWTYLFFRNGCEVSCGTFDVVLLENGQVVDAIVRGRGHVYSGVSSSPPERPAEFTPPTAGT